MQTVNASVILEDAQRMIGWDLEQLEPRQEQMTRQAMSLALQEIWESWWWEQLMKCQRVQFYPGIDFNNHSSYQVGSLGVTFLYSQPEDAYYQPVFSANQPVADAPLKWLLAKTADEIAGFSYYDETKTYAAGDTIRFEQDALGDITMKGFVAVIDAPGNPQLNPNNWQEVLEFLPNLATAYINPVYGNVRTVTQLDPRSTPNTTNYPVNDTADGPVLPSLDVARPWVWYRRPSPIITGDEFDSTLTYTATPAGNLTFT